MKKLLFGFIILASALILLSSLATEADASIEIIPYAWLAGIDADITVGDRKGSIDVGFDDLVDYVDFAGGLMVTGESNRWVFEFQGDYMSLDSDKDATKFDQLGTLETKMTILEGAIGYRFPLFKKVDLDVMIGGRYTEIENTFKAASGNTFERDSDLADPMLVLRPLVQITERLWFNPTLSIGGGGDSDLIYELQPQLHYYFTPNFGLVVGYRQLYYDIKDDNHEFDGMLHGALFGVSFKF